MSDFIRTINEINDQIKNLHGIRDDMIKDFEKNNGLKIGTKVTRPKMNGNRVFVITNKWFDTQYNELLYAIHDSGGLDNEIPTYSCCSEDTFKVVS